MIDRFAFQLGLPATPGTVTVGALMSTFPAVAPTLEFSDVAGTAIPPGSSAVTITLPFNAPAAQTVTVRAEGFTGSVPIRVAVIPVSGPSAHFDDEIDMAGQPSATRTVNVSVPQNVPVVVQAWTR